MRDCFIIVLLIFGQCIVFGQSGFVDTNFGINGLVETELTSMYYSSIKTDHESIYVIGSDIFNNLNRVGVQKFDITGNVLENFGVNGVAYININNSNLYGTALHVLQDEAILISGFIRNSENFHSMFTAKLKSNGELDLEFGDDGIIEITIENKQTASTSSYLDEFGNIYLAGWIQNNEKDALCVRLTEDGELDASFANSGYFELTKEGTNEVFQSITGSQDKIYLGRGEGSFGPCDVHLIDNNANYIVEFADGGIKNLDHLHFIEKMQVGPFEKLHLSGINYFYNSSFIRLMENGFNDLSFSGDGEVSIALGYNRFVLPPKAINLNNDFVLFENGDWICNGTVEDEPGPFSHRRIGMLSLNSNGSLDQEFGIDGFPEITYPYNYCWDISAIDDSFIVLVAYSTSHVFLVKYNAGLHVGGLNEVLTADDQSLTYPNPTQSDLKIKFIIETPQILTFNILNIDGKAIRTTDFSIHQSGENTITMDVSDLVSGRYFVRISANGNSKHTISFIKR